MNSQEEWSNALDVLRPDISRHHLMSSVQSSACSFDYFNNNNDDNKSLKASVVYK